MSAGVMLTYAPNVSWLFPELPFALRPKAAADLGFGAIEFGFPSQADLQALASARQDLGLEIVLFNQDVPVWEAGNRGYLVDPQRRAEFDRTLDQALEIVRRLGVRKVMLPAGVVLPELARRVQHDCMVENLRRAAPQAKDAHTLLTIEVLNDTDNPRYYLTSPEEAFQVVDEVNHSHLRAQIDSYHMAVLGHDPASIVRQGGTRVGHIQFADYPGRHEPGSGKIDFAAIERAADEIGYPGPIGLEFVPHAKGAAALAWVPQARRTHPNLTTEKSR
jgi:hydroxypyruvate isomerase